MASQYIYFGQGTETRRASLIQKADGKVSATSTPLFTGLGDVGDIVIDKTGKKLYWTDAANSQIMVGNLDINRSPRSVFSNNGNAEIVYPVGLAIANGKIYWAKPDLIDH